MNFKAIIGFFVGVSFMGAIGFQFTYSTKVAYVRSTEVINRYHGTIEAKQIYEAELNGWKNELLKIDSAYDSFSEAQKQKVDLRLGQLEKKASEQNDKITKGVINQINDYIKKYCKKQEFDLVVAPTVAGSVIYANDKIDITEDIIKGLNNEYKPK